MMPYHLPSEFPKSDEANDRHEPGGLDERPLGSWAALKCVTPVLVAVVWLVGHLGGYVQDVGFPICPAQVMETTE